MDKKKLRMAIRKHFSCLTGKDKKNMEVKILEEVIQ